MSSIAWSARSREVPNDFYETPAWCTKRLLKILYVSGYILEPCNGLGAISKILPIMPAIRVDIDPKMEYDVCDNFLTMYFGDNKFDHIITNPPFKTNGSGEFVERAMGLLNDGGVASFLMRLLFLESARRKPLLLKYPPQVHNLGRVNMGGTGICYAWFIFKKNYHGPIIFHP